MSEYNQQETLSTCRFGQRAKSIKNNAKINRELTVGEYKILLEKMEKELASLRKQKGMPTGTALVEDRGMASPPLSTIIPFSTKGTYEFNEFDPFMRSSSKTSSVPSVSRRVFKVLCNAFIRGWHLR